jgi:hypothetical protein
MTGKNGRSRKRPWISFPPAGLATLNRRLDSSHHGSHFHPVKWQRDISRFWAARSPNQRPDVVASIFPFLARKKKAGPKVRPGMKVKTSRGERAGRMGGTSDAPRM